MGVAKVFYPNAPTCPECGEEMVWDEDEDIWYCLNCGYWEEGEEYLDDEEEDEWEELECLGLINIAYGEHCEVCEFREVCEEIAKRKEEEGA